MYFAIDPNHVFLCCHLQIIISGNRRLDAKWEGAAVLMKILCRPTGETQPHDEHDVQQRAVREEMLLAGAVFSIPSKQRNAKISLGMHSSCPIYCVVQLTVVGTNI